MSSRILGNFIQGVGEREREGGGWSGGSICLPLLFSGGAHIHSGLSTKNKEYVFELPILVGITRQGRPDIMTKLQFPTHSSFA